ncbi:chemotaxis protein CheW [Oceanobacillus jeddahense]|uniref:Chemotaxis protein CheW n=1 Tax=Oceanobacillus jeddahense TaxID=1462527 RepID=A0ABY5JMI5_9BACI|nr:chemotaxis protein CheW [Oceanobacillus jeddahense]UUI01521.1 chemotaxis protein CheW [Oceanobacillus jeddahense]
MIQEQLTPERLEKTIIFDLNDSEYGLPVNFVESIETALPITRVPHDQNYIKGVINLRGKIIPVIDLRIRLGEVREHRNEEDQIIITRIGETQVGLIIDSANDVLDIPENLLETPPETIGTVKKEYIHSIVHFDDRLIVLLDIYKLLNLEEIKTQGMDDH